MTQAYGLDCFVSLPHYVVIAVQLEQAPISKGRIYNIGRGMACSGLLLFQSAFVGQRPFHIFRLFDRMQATRLKTRSS